MDADSFLEPVPSSAEPAALTFRHTTITDGDGEPAAQLERWDIAVIATGPEPSSHHDRTETIGRVSAVTVLHPRNLAEIERALEAGAGHVADTFVDAIATPSPRGSRFREHFIASRALSGQRDLLIVTDVRIREQFRHVDGLLCRIIAGVSSGPAGRNAAYVVLEPSGWDIAAKPQALRGFAVTRTAQELDRAGFEPWANTAMLTHANVPQDMTLDIDDDPRLPPAEPTEQLPVGTPHAMVRTGELWLGDIVDDAKHADGLRVPFDLPPALDPALVEAVPADIDRVLADETTGTLIIVTDTSSYEVVGRPGNAPQLVGDAATAGAGTQAWLREVHHRWWTYRTRLLNQADERISEVLDGMAKSVGPDQPHITVPPLTRHQVPWPGVGDIELRPTIFETDTTRVLDVVQTVNQRETTIGRVAIDATGYIHARIDDDRNLNLGDPSIAITYILQLAANSHLAGILDTIIDRQLTTSILTGTSGP
jgi:hypothetical protein